MPTYNTLPKPSPFFKGKLYDKFVEDLILDDKKKRTVYGYVRAVRKLSEFHQRPPEKLSEQDIRDYFLHQIIDREVASGTQSVILSGLKFFYRITCPRDWKTLDQTKIARVTTLPEVITQPQVFQIIDAATSFRMKAFLWTTYTLGLRIGEAVHLQIGNVDSQRMMVHVHQGKGAKDRYIPLPESTLCVLRKLWLEHRNPTFVFPARGRKQQSGANAKTPMSISTVQTAIKKITNELNFGKKISCHTLRKACSCYDISLRLAI